MAAHEESLRRLALHDEQCIQSLLGIRLRRAEAAGLDPKTHALVRLAALMAMDASCVSYGWAVDAALTRGELKFRLEGKKLRGSWVLVRTRGRPGDSKPAWLLIKHRDEWTSTEEVTELAPRSIVSNRLLVEIARDEGGNVRKAADGDPPALLREILNNPGMLAPARKSRKKAVWHSNRAMS